MLHPLFQPLWSGLKDDTLLITFLSPQTGFEPWDNLPCFIRGIEFWGVESFNAYPGIYPKRDEQAERADLLFLAS